MAAFDVGGLANCRSHQVVTPAVPLPLRPVLAHGVPFRVGGRPGAGTVTSACSSLSVDPFRAQSGEPTGTIRTVGPLHDSSLVTGLVIWCQNPLVSAQHTVTLLTRPGCHLCDDARAVIESVCRELGVPWDERDITADPEDFRRYADSVPVTLVDGAEHDFLRVSADRLRRALTAG